MSLDVLDFTVVLNVFFLLIWIGYFCLQKYSNFQNAVKKLTSNKYGIMLIMIAFATVVGISITNLGVVEPLVVTLMLQIIVAIAVNYMYNSYEYGASSNEYKICMLVLFVLLAFFIGSCLLVVGEDRFFNAPETETQAVQQHLTTLRIISGIVMVLFWVFFIFLTWRIEKSFSNHKARLLKQPILISMLLVLSCYVFNKVAGREAGWVMMGIFAVVAIICGVAITKQTDFATVFTHWDTDKGQKIYFIVVPLIFAALFNISTTIANKYPGQHEAVPIVDPVSKEVKIAESSPPMSLIVYNSTMVIVSLALLIFAGVYVCGKKNMIGIDINELQKSNNID